jgi:hypothetical protein
VAVLYSAMDVKEAVKLAMKYVADLFEEEQIENLGLEEVEFEDGTDSWHVTIGFSRPWDHVSGLALRNTLNRSYKVVAINNSTGIVLSVKNRDVSTAA